MIPAGDRLAAVLAEISVSELALPVITNVEAAPNQDPGRVRDLLVRQVSAPVRWQETIACMNSLGVNRYIEIGPGKVLVGLAKRMAKDSLLQNVQDAADVSSLAG
jgi:[acyl-carrier-protein] S-malonyltransferase